MQWHTLSYVLLLCLARVDASCNKGFYLQSGTCTLCASGKYKATTGSEACTDCPANFGSMSGAYYCMECTSFTGGTLCTAENSMFNGYATCSVGQCECNFGYRGSIINPGQGAMYDGNMNFQGYYESSPSGNCALCPAGKYKLNYIGDGFCDNCPADQQCANGILVISCPEGKTAPAGSTSSSQCVCMTGYSAGPNAAACFNCNSVPNGQVITGGYYTGLCGCKHGYYGKIISPGNDLLGGSTVYTLAQSGGTCYACPAGKWAYPEANLLYATIESGTCADCPTGKTSNPASFGLDGNAACTLVLTPTSCETGTYLSGQSCVSCVAGSYKATTGTEACTSCPAGTYSTIVASAACTNCPQGKYTAETGSVSENACLNCPEFSTSPAGSSAVTQCTCNSGYDQVGSC